MTFVYGPVSLTEATEVECCDKRSIFDRHVRAETVTQLRCPSCDREPWWSHGWLYKHEQGAEMFFNVTSAGRMRALPRISVGLTSEERRWLAKKIEEIHFLIEKSRIFKEKGCAE